MNKKPILTIGAVVITTLALIPLGAAIAGCSEDSPNNHTCDSDAPNPHPGNYNAGGGNDNVTVDSGAGVTGDLRGGDDNDTMTNNGVVGGNLAGNEGNDNITNNGDVGDNIRGNDGNDTIVNNGYVENGVSGNAGEDNITNNEDGDVGFITGGVDDDTINNHGYVEYDISGNSGDDKITNHSSGDVGDIYGDLGSDTIINDGYVDDEIHGGTGGCGCGIDSDDTIINNGFVGNDIEGDDGNDTITNRGDVGDDIDADRGDDTVTIYYNSTVGGDIDGDDQDSIPDAEEGTNDVLIFKVKNDSDKELLESKDPAADSATLSNGNFFQWLNFESLLVKLIGGGGDAAEITGPICIYNDFVYLVVCLTEDGLAFYRLDENREGHGIGHVTYAAIGAAEPGDTILDDTTEDGYRLVVSLPEENMLQFELFWPDNTQVVDATIEFGT